LLSKGTGPYFYLPKLENHLEARLWNDVFNFAQDELKIPRGSIRATVLIETILAAFEMDEILYELREHSSGLNCGRWDYIFSYIKKFQAHPEFVLPDRSLVTMETHFLSSYVELLVKSATGAASMRWVEWRHRFPSAMMRPPTSRRSTKCGATNFAKCKPAMMAPGSRIRGWFRWQKKFSTSTCPNQIRFRSRERQSRTVEARDLLEVPKGEITEAGLRWNIDVGMQYLHSWLGGLGCVPIYNLMEDAATAEISRAQVWQWLRYGAHLKDGKPVSEAMVKEIIHQRAAELGSNNDKKLQQAAKLLEDLTTSREFAEFLTLASYDLLD
jgi:malate synthase